MTYFRLGDILGNMSMQMVHFGFWRRQLWHPFILNNLKATA